MDAVPAALPDARVAQASSGSSARRRRSRRPSTPVDGGAALAGGAPVTGFSLCAISLAAGRAVVRRLVRAGLRDAGSRPSPRSLDRSGRRCRDAAVDCGAGAAGWRVHAPDRATRCRASTVLTDCCRARELQRAVGGFRAFAPLPRDMSIAAPTTGYDDVKRVALARLLATGIESIQVDWSLYGPEARAGRADRWRRRCRRVSAAVETGTLGARRSPLEEIRGNIRAAGLEPVERDGRFDGRIGVDRAAGPPRRRRLPERAAARLRPRAHARICSRCATTCRRSAPRCCTNGVDRLG